MSPTLVVMVVVVCAQSTPALDHPSHWGTPSWAIYMDFEHERIHIETSSVLIREVRHTGVPGGVPGASAPAAAAAAWEYREASACLLLKTQPPLPVQISARKLH